MSCRGCIYHETHLSSYQCNYLLYTGHSRGCPIEGCTRKETKGKAKQHKPRPVTLKGSLPKITTGQKAPQKPGVRLSFDEARALGLHHAGKSDAEIGAALGKARNTILAWRVRRGLPRNCEKGRPKK